MLTIYLFLLIICFICLAEECMEPMVFTEENTPQENTEEHIVLRIAENKLYKSYPQLKNTKVKFYRIYKRYSIKLSKYYIVRFYFYANDIYVREVAYKITKKKSFYQCLLIDRY